MSREQWRGCGNTEVFNTLAWKERPRKQSRLVRWIPPEAGWVKLNIAGVWKAESGMGGVIQDEKDSLIQGFLGKATSVSVLEAQLQTLMKGLAIARDQGRKIWVELDNLEVVKMLQNKKFGAAAMRHQVTDICNMLKQVDVKITHILSQGNKATASLALKESKERAHKVFEQESAPQMTP
ncbi:hypothetical protein SASPL_138362 [Salvia splendens]|uniref:RNase H type-1 domain-containing protein n=1 Tax=Salvia splendens TaxID=180675 RepID=A0A8X8ZEY9_SALSN|nr:hypothetical protein SASPL_138362 [Salvia splendens]